MAALHELDLTMAVFDQLKRDRYNKQREQAVPITHAMTLRMNPFLVVQPMEDGRAYIYRDVLLVSSGGWWVATVFQEGKVFNYHDGALDSLMDQIDRAINRHIAREAVKAVIAKQHAECPVCPGCKNEIDPEVCHCGDEISRHDTGSGHSPVPMGCTCGYAK